MKLIFICVAAAVGLFISGPAFAGHKHGHAVHEILDAVSGDGGHHQNSHGHNQGHGHNRGHGHDDDNHGHGHNQGDGHGNGHNNQGHGHDEGHDH